MEDKKQLQEKYMQLQMIEQQMQKVQKQLNLLENQIQELNITEQAIDDIQEAKVGTEILVPMASGIFVKAELKNNQDLAVNVGADTVVKKSVEDTKQLITQQIKEVSKMHQDLTANLEKLAGSAQIIEKELSKLIV